MSDRTREPSVSVGAFEPGFVHAEYPVVPLGSGREPPRWIRVRGAYRGVIGA
ncbi:hypothetical protein [Halovivax gelatinilyticus]|uniref:hypothetical protein n=1 Tax=Halovivax gelatinilyticus TaxID=2961597 RepID=UPI0020CA4E72|nr:hypothetical protein [Halovivax gelatinilyticus]